MLCCVSPLLEGWNEREPKPSDAQHEMEEEERKAVKGAIDGFRFGFDCFACKTLTSLRVG